jgi:hypothetical protein
MLIIRERNGVNVVPPVPLALVLPRSFLTPHSFYLLLVQAVLVADGWRARLQLLRVRLQGF